jgi:hypothetical protein
VQRRQHQTQFAGDEIDDGQDAGERQQRETSQLHANRLCASLILTPALTRVNTLVNAPESLKYPEQAASSTETEY